MKNYKFQGDIDFIPFTGEITGEIVEHNGSIIVAYGEKSGHTHTVNVPRIEDMEVRKLQDGRFLLTLKTEAKVKHQEHGEITLSPSTYIVDREREYDWFAKTTRQVRD